MDMSNSMRLIARRCFPNAMRTIDRFHIQKLACDALQEMRIAHRWDAIQADTDAREEGKNKYKKQGSVRKKTNKETKRTGGNPVGGSFDMKI